MNEEVKVYVKTTAFCGPCMFTKKKLDELNIPYEEVKGEDHTEELEDMGFRSFPVVVTKHNGSWSGYQQSKLEELATAMAV